MCFRVRLDSKHAIAKEDIVIYKVGKCVGANFRPRYQTQWLYLRDKVNPKVKLTAYNTQIDRGYHGFDRLSVDNLHRWLSDKGEICDVGMFTIPKGAEYYCNTTRSSKATIVEYVSNELIYKGEL